MNPLDRCLGTSNTCATHDNFLSPKLYRVSEAAGSCSCRGSGGRPGPPDQDHTARAAGAQCASALTLCFGPDTVHTLISICSVVF